MARARGANGIVALAMATAGYGTIPTSGFRKVPVVSIDLGEDQDVLDDVVLGFGRDPQDGGDDVIKNEGSAVVPIDLRHFGLWLKLMLGQPVTTAGIFATGSYAFSAQPANNAVLTVNGTAVTLVTGAPSAGQCQIGATLAETVANLVAFLNASADGAIDDATYSASLSGAVLNITHDTVGTGGNSFTLVAGTSPATNATRSAATLTGGAASGAYNHVFTAGQLAHPDAAIQLGFPEVPHYGMNYGVMANDLSIQMQRSGLLNATIGLIGQGENTDASSLSGSLEADWVMERFSQFSGVIEQDGVPLGKIESATLRIGNNLDKDESIRPDGRIGGADPAMLSVGLDITVRFADRTLFDKATAKAPISARLGWQISALKRLDFIMENVRLPRRKVGLNGPGGIRVTFQMKPTEKAATQRTLRAVLVNDIASY